MQISRKIMQFPIVTKHIIKIKTAIIKTQLIKRLK
jgi:hypothetical protein